MPGRRAVGSTSVGAGAASAARASARPAGRAAPRGPGRGRLQVLEGLHRGRALVAGLGRLRLPLGRGPPEIVGLAAPLVPLGLGRVGPSLGPGAGGLGGGAGPTLPLQQAAGLVLLPPVRGARRPRRRGRPPSPPVARATAPPRIEGLGVDRLGHPGPERIVVARLVRGDQRPRHAVAHARGRVAAPRAPPPPRPHGPPPGPPRGPRAAGRCGRRSPWRPRPRRPTRSGARPRRPGRTRCTRPPRRPRPSSSERSTVSSPPTV